MNLKDRPTQLLLQAKRNLKDIDTIIIERLGRRLSELVQRKLGEPATIFWEDISLYSSSDDVVVTGTRMFEVGDELVEDGVTLTITEDNVNAVAQRVKLMIPMEIIEMIEDTSQSIDDVEHAINTIAVSPDARESVKQTPLEVDLSGITDPAMLSLISRYMTSTTKH